MEKSIFIPNELFLLKRPINSLSVMDTPKIRELPASLANYYHVKSSLLLLTKALAQLAPEFDEQKLPLSIQDDFRGYSDSMSQYISDVNFLNKENLSKYIVERANELGTPDEEKLQILANFLLTWTTHARMVYAFLWMGDNLEKLKRDELAKDYLELALIIWKKIAAADIWCDWNNFLRSIIFGTRKFCLSTLESIKKEGTELTPEQMEELESAIDWVIDANKPRKEGYM